MGKVSGVQWTDSSWGPWRGCTKVTTECKNCYAEREMNRWGMDFGKITRSKTTFMAPLSWSEPKLVFVCPWSDFFHPDVPPEWRKDAWHVMVNASQHTYIIPTKRPELIPQMLPADWGDGYPNVWLLVSAGTNDIVIRFWSILRNINAIVRGISMEPLLEDLAWYPGRPDWVLAGGESGPHRRQMDPAWARSIRDECTEFGIPFFFKGHVGDRHDEENGLLDGRTWHEYPTDILRGQD